MMGSKDIDFVAVNDLTYQDARPPAPLRLGARPLPGKVETDGDGLVVDGDKIKVPPRRIPRRSLEALGVDLVLESTGRFTDGTRPGSTSRRARKVVISAPAKKEDITIVMGCERGQVRSPGPPHSFQCSCTTNCLVPVVKVILDNFGFVNGS
jgi:glyceraldehyde 3-phosphate dehydrogenase